MNAGTLFETLSTSGKLEDEAFGRLQRAVAEEAAQERSPWYFQALTALGAWVASLFFLGFAGAALGAAFEKSFFLLTVLGLILIGAAGLVRRRVAGLFGGQVCLAVSMTGHLLVLVAIGMKCSEEQLQHPTAIVATAAAALAAGGYFLYRDACHRFLASLVALLFGTAAIYDLTGRTWNDWEASHPVFDRWIVLAMAAHVAVLGLVFLRRSGTLWRPLGYAVALSLVAMQFTYRFGLFGSAWMRPESIGSGAIFLLALLGLGWRLAGGKEAWDRAPSVVFILGFFTVALGVVAPPPLLLSLGFLFLGHARQDRFFEWGGLLFLGYSLIVYYYTLSVDLASKSLILCASGALLLAALGVLKKTVWKA